MLVWFLFAGNIQKNDRLIRERQVSFEEAVWAILNGDLLDVLEHPNPEKYPGQKIFVVQLKQYCFLEPFVAQGNQLFLKTIIPSRKMTKKYLKGEINHGPK
ncbi:MAG TPA: toxin [Thermotogota bacterium]|nr:toxin [Thermotogota bacterium]